MLSTIFSEIYLKNVFVIINSLAFKFNPTILQNTIYKYLSYRYFIVRPYKRIILEVVLYIINFDNDRDLKLVTKLWENSID